MLLYLNALELHSPWFKQLMIEQHSCPLDYDQLWALKFILDKWHVHVLLSLKAVSCSTFVYLNKKLYKVFIYEQTFLFVF